MLTLISSHRHDELQTNRKFSCTNNNEKLLVKIETIPAVFSGLQSDLVILNSSFDERFVGMRCSRWFLDTEHVELQSNSKF